MYWFFLYVRNFHELKAVFVEFGKRLDHDQIFGSSGNFNEATSRRKQASHAISHA